MGVRVVKESVCAHGGGIDGRGNIPVQSGRLEEERVYSKWCAFDGCVSGQCVCMDSPLTATVESRAVVYPKARTVSPN